jgi:hypothetical protein
MSKEKWTTGGDLIDWIDSVFKTDPILANSVGGTGWTEADMAYVMAATTVEEGSARVCEVEDRIWYEIAKTAFKE